MNSETTKELRKCLKGIVADLRSMGDISKAQKRGLNKCIKNLSLM